MLTQCPNCETTFRVTADILRVADGQVRCGRCHTQFDALERLIEEGDPNEALSGRYLQSPVHTSPESIEVDEPEAMEEITLEGKGVEISGTYRSLDDDDAEAHVHQEVIEEWAQVEDEDLPEQAETQDVARAAESDVEAAAADDAAVDPPLRATRAPLGSRRAFETPVEADAPDELVEFATPRRARTPLIWKLLVLPLALLLFAQVVHHYRAELARHPRLGEPLMQAYESLGMQLTPDWDLHAYGVKQWGVVMNPAAPGTLVVRASITNNAGFPQPYPLLKLVLEDRWGDQVRAREFEPSEYLDAGTAADRLLAPAQQTNATIAIVDPGPDAEGFRFDVCLRGKAGPVCAGEVPSAR